MSAGARRLFAAPFYGSLTFLLCVRAGSPFEVAFLRDQRATSDSCVTTSVYYDEPGGCSRGKGGFPMGGWVGGGGLGWVGGWVACRMGGWVGRLPRKEAVARLLHQVTKEGGRGRRALLTPPSRCSPGSNTPAGSLPRYHDRLRKDDGAWVVRLRW